MEEAKKEITPGVSIDPAMIQAIGSLLSGLSQKGTTEQSKEDATPSAKEAAPVSASPTLSVGSDGLSALLSNPAIPELLPKLLPLIKPAMASISPQKEASSPSKEDPAVCREHLLLALKPFLSAGRRNAVDTLLTVAKLGSVLQLLK